MSTETESADEPLVRVAALHALAYCERLFYLEEVEEIRRADERVYAGRTLHVELAVEDGDRAETLHLSSQPLGLVGRVDAIRRRDGRWFPYEHKRGRPFRDRDGEVKAWPSDELQVAAYGLLLEEHVGERVLEGRVRYHAENVTVRVQLDDANREAVLKAVEKARDLRVKLDRPPVTKAAGRCIRCSLAPVCLPEEERLAVSSEWEPVRLFPPHREGQCNGSRFSPA